MVWVLLPGRLLGTVLLTAPLAVRHELRPPGSAWPLVLATALAEVIGIASYTLGARHQIAIAAVIASQFAALSRSRRLLRVRRAPDEAPAGGPRRGPDRRGAVGG